MILKALIVDDEEYNRKSLYFLIQSNCPFVNIIGMYRSVADARNLLKANNEVLSIYEDSKGKVWFLNLNGRLDYYSDGKFYNPENTVTLNNAVKKSEHNRLF